MSSALQVQGSRWLPASLFGRLMLVLAGGLMLAQLLSAAINVAERDRLLARNFGLQPAQRIADVVTLLDSLPRQERDRVVAVFGVPPLVLSLRDDPGIALPTDGPLTRRPENGPDGLPDAGADAVPEGSYTRGAMFAERLRAALGDDRPARVEARADYPPGRGTVDGTRRHPPRAEGDRPRRMGHVRAAMAVVRTEVQLRDGQWARFDTDLPAAPEALPWRLVGTLAVLLLTMLVLSWIAVRWIVKPLHVLAQAAQALGEDIARPPLPEVGPREVRQAAQAFNTMQQRLARFIGERTRMLTALSHDLKTPLTRMRLRTELLDDDEARTRFESDLLEMEAMVTQTLDFMRGLGGHEARTPVDIGALLDSLQSDNEAMGRTLVVEGQDVGHHERRQIAPFIGVPSLLKRALGNLVDNAMLYGAGATLRVEDLPDRLVIHVLDSGPGIPEADLERVFEPFHRLEASRSRATGGTGLGLGIARSIAQLHGGDLTLHNRTGGGLDAVLSLPRRGV